MLLLLVIDYDIFADLIYDYINYLYLLLNHLILLNVFVKEHFYNDVLFHNIYDHLMILKQVMVNRN